MKPFKNIARFERISNFVEMSDSYENIAKVLAVAFCPFLRDEEQTQISAGIVDLFKKKERGEIPSALFSIATDDQLDDAARCIRELQYTEDGIARLIRLIGTYDLNKLIRNTYPATPSRLSFNENGEIKLIDYHSGGLRLSTAARALYLLFLLHPEGISHKDLINYRQQFLEIYLEISPRTDVEGASRTINRVSNPESDDLFVEISKIKKAFNDIFAPDIAYQYIPMLNKDTQRYVIRLDRRYVSIPKWSIDMIISAPLIYSNISARNQSINAEATFVGVRKIESTTNGKKNLALAIDYIPKGETRAQTTMPFSSAHYLTPEELTLIQTTEIVDIEVSSFAHLICESGKIDIGRDEQKRPQISIRWLAWKDASNNWHRPSDSSILFPEINYLG